MPITLTRDEYNEKKRSPLKADRDALDEMMAEGATVENLPQAEQPSLLGFGREMWKKLTSKPEAQAAPPKKESMVTFIGNNMRRSVELRNALTNPNEVQGMKDWARLNREVGIDEINTKNMREDPYREVQRKLKKKEAESGGE